MSEELIGAAALTGRYVIGCVLLMAALPKLFARRQFAQAVANYQLLPDRLVHPVAAWLPRVEVICGGCLLLGIAIKPVAAVTGVMLGAFAVAVTVNLIQGREIECGCSGTVAPRRIGWSLVVGDLALAVVAAGVALADPGVLRFSGEGSPSNAGLTASDGVAALLIGSSLVLLYLLFASWFGLRNTMQASSLERGTA